MGRRKPRHRGAADGGQGGGAGGSEEAAPPQCAGGGDVDGESDPGAGQSTPQSIAVCDPATKQRIVLQWEETHHTAGRTVLLDNLAAGRKRDSYLCMLYQKGLCRSHQRCNQIHAEKQKVQELREKFFTAHGRPQGQDEPHAHQRALEIVVMDPVDDSSRLTLPFAKTGDTKGRREFFASQQFRGGALKDFSICPSFLNGAACAQGAACADIHADRNFIKHIVERKPCCPFHGDEPSRVEGFKGRLFMVNKNNQRCPVPIERVAATKGSKELLPTGGQIIFACNRVCRLHQEKRCPWLAACANLHLCREFYAVYSGCSNPSLTCLPSQPGLQILPSGKMREMRPPQPQPAADAHRPPSPAGAEASPAPATGVPLQTSEPRSGWGIPLVTEEGLVPRQLLPPLALQRYPSAGMPSGSHPPPSSGAEAPPPGWMPGTVPFGNMQGMMAMWSQMAGGHEAAGGMFPPGMFPPWGPPPGFGGAGAPAAGGTAPAPPQPPVPQQQQPQQGGYAHPPQPPPPPAAPKKPRGPPPAPHEVPESLQQVEYAQSEPDEGDEDMSPLVPGEGMHSQTVPSFANPHSCPHLLHTNSATSIPPPLHSDTFVGPFGSQQSPEPSQTDPMGGHPCGGHQLGYTGPPQPGAVSPVAAGACGVPLGAQSYPPPPQGAPHHPPHGGYGTRGAGALSHHPHHPHPLPPQQPRDPTGAANLAAPADSFRSSSGQHMPYGPEYD